jgi:peptide/nickel transport system substrate-binding protein
MYPFNRSRPRPSAERARSTRATRALRASVMLAAGTLLAGGCASSGGGAAPAATASSALTLAYPIPPTSLDPAQFGSASYWELDLAYEPLIMWGPTGTPQPALATSWGYVGTGNKTFQLTLRRGVRFSDGSALTAQAVKASMDYFIKSGGPASALWAGTTITVTGPYEIQISSQSPNPDFPYLLSQDNGAGDIISPGALLSPKRLGSTTDGAGQYVLQSQQTVAGNQYTFTPNPYYWNKSAVHYRTVTIKIIPNQNSILDALKSGEVNAAKGDYSTAAAAQGAGLHVQSFPYVFEGLILLDRGGKLAPALADPRVRQALNYAVNRPLLTRALLGTFGTPTDQTDRPGTDGWLDATTYPYDPAKARQLLAQAGYAHGLTIPVVTSSYLGMDQLVEAMAGELAAVGVTLSISNVSTVQYVGGALSGKYPAAGIAWGVGPLYLQGPQLFLPNAEFNPFHTTDQAIDTLAAKSAAASGTEHVTLAHQVEEQLTSQAWFVPVALTPEFYFAQTSVDVSSETAGEPSADPVWWQPAK